MDYDRVRAVEWVVCEHKTRGVQLGMKVKHKIVMSENRPLAVPCSFVTSNA